MKIAIVLGTRPEIIKMSPLIRLLKKKKDNYFIVHTGQHYSYTMDRLFFKELNLPKPKYNLKVGSGSHAFITGETLKRIEEILIKEKPSVVLVEGDTDSVLAGALAAAKLGIKVGHIEAGLRSYDREMPEEINRLLTDHISDFLFCPTKKSAKTALGEGIGKEKIFITGNTIVDGVWQNLKLAQKKSKVLEKLNLSPRSFILITAHRQENVDQKEKLKNLVKGLEKACQYLKIPGLWPIHPRTVERLKQFKIKLSKEIRVAQPIGYLDFLFLESKAKLILTDSGGLQEEACILKVPCVTLRENTERPETLEVGSNMLAGTEPEKILKATQKMIKRKTNWRNPFGNGKASEKIRKILKAK